MSSGLIELRSRYIGPLATGAATMFTGLAVALALGVFSAPGAHAAAGNIKVGSNIPQSVPTVQATVPPICNVAFSDVPITNPFYEYVRCLACRNIIGGYGDGTFRPNNNVTRGQLAKMVASAAGYTDAIAGSRQTFHDIEPQSTYWEYVERVSMHGVTSGYPCSTAPGSSEACDSQNRPYFRPNGLVTRQQVAKMVSIAKGLVGSNGGNRSIPVAEPTTVALNYTFADVLPGNSFYTYVEALAHLNSISGYDCGGTNPDGGAAEPCDPANRKYFRPANNMTRGQIAKVLSLTFSPNCQTPVQP